MKVGRDLISRVTDAVMDDVRDWCKRPLEDIYPIVFLDCTVLKIREGGTVQRRALYLALGVTLDGDRDVLGMWFQETEGAKFWMQVLSDLKTRGVRDILICCVDGLTGSDQDQGALPQRGRGPQARLPRAPERCAPVDPNEELDRGAARAQDPLRRPRPRHHRMTPNRPIRSSR